MQTESIEIVTSKEKFFLEYLTLKKPVINALLTKLNRKKTSLSAAQMKILAQLLYYNDLYRDKQDEEKWDLIFSKEVRTEIRNKLGIKEHYYNNYISQLRNLKIIDGKKIKNVFIVYANDNCVLNFTFRLNGHKE